AAAFIPGFTRGVRLVGLHVTLLDPQMERQLVLGL
ncbi:hypothetical protein, partial [Escherichia coli]